jgi:hypothetical protein
MATVNSAATTASILAANAQRKGAVIHNTDANALYLLLGVGTASSSNKHYVLNNNDTWECPAGYTGDVQGVWTADGSGAAITAEW